MSNTTSALLTKWAVTFIAAVIAFRVIANASWTMVFMLSFATTIANYLIGDIVILPSMGNVIAAVSDGVLGAVAALLFGVFSDYFVPTTMSLVAYGALIAVFEYFFHMYLLSNNRVAP